MQKGLHKLPSDPMLSLHFCFDKLILYSVFCLTIFTSRLRHGHREANVLVLVLVGTFYSQIFLIPVNYNDHPNHLNQPNQPIWGRVQGVGLMGWVNTYNTHGTCMKS